MDAIKAAFEAQFGTEWSTPVVENAEGSEKTAQGQFNEERSSEDDQEDSAEEVEESFPNQTQEGPVVIKHDDKKLAAHQLQMTKAQRRKFMTSGAPKDDSIINTEQPTTKEDNEDLQNDLALQRLIEESHILNENQAFSGSDISGVVDPMEHVGKTRLKVMEARLAKAGAKRKTQRMPQAMAVGIRDKKAERKQKYKEEAREAGIVVAKERHAKSKNRYRDKGLKINSIGKASEHGIHVSQAEIAKISGKSRALKAKRKGGKRA